MGASRTANTARASTANGMPRPRPQRTPSRISALDIGGPFRGFNHAQYGFESGLAVSSGRLLDVFPVVPKPSEPPSDDIRRRVACLVARRNIGASSQEQGDRL